MLSNDRLHSVKLINISLKHEIKNTYIFLHDIFNYKTVMYTNYIAVQFQSKYFKTYNIHNALLYVIYTYCTHK